MTLLRQGPAEDPNMLLASQEQERQREIRRDWSILNKVNATKWQVEEAYLRLLKAGEIDPGEPW